MDSSKSNKKYILKDNYTLNKSNYEKIKLADQYNQLYSNEYRDNLNNQIKYDNEKIYNLSLKSLLQNASLVYMEIVSELSNFLSMKNKSLNSLGLIFTKNDRLLYVGLFILTISFCLWIINILG